MSWRERAERGSATVAAVGATLGLLIAGLLGVAVMSIHAQKTFTQAVADLAALAGAGASPSSLLGDAAAACAVAARVAEENGLNLDTCVADGFDLRVVVRKEVSIPVWPPTTVTARARAGPAL